MKKAKKPSWKNFTKSNKTSNTTYGLDTSEHTVDFISLMIEIVHVKDMAV